MSKNDGLGHSGCALLCGAAENQEVLLIGWVRQKRIFGDWVNTEASVDSGMQIVQKYVR